MHSRTQNLRLPFGYGEVAQDPGRRMSNLKSIIIVVIRVYEIARARLSRIASCFSTRPSYCYSTWPWDSALFKLRLDCVWDPAIM